MRHYPSVWACAVLAGLFFASAGAGTEKSEKSVPFPRRNPTTEAFQKTKTSIVTVLVPRPSGGKDIVGTGVIFDERGYLVTNRHVVDRVKRVKIQLHDGEVVLGEVVMAEPAWDLAVVHISTKKPLQALPFSPASDLMEGEKVIAIGHPFGYRYTVSEGIISALDREIEMPTRDVLTGLIQHTASINPGNSGGPLLNINGELIGINVALRQEAQGIAFALNAGSVKEVLKRHMSAARLAGVDHGLVCKDEVVGETGPRQKVLVETCAPDMGGSLSRGDQIVAVGDKGVVNSFDIERALWSHKPGEKVELRVIRDGKEVMVTLTLRSDTDARPALETTHASPSGMSVSVAASARR